MHRETLLRRVWKLHKTRTLSSTPLYLSTTNRTAPPECQDPPARSRVIRLHASKLTSSTEWLTRHRHHCGSIHSYPGMKFLPHRPAAARSWAQQQARKTKSTRMSTKESTTDEGVDENRATYGQSPTRWRPAEVARMAATMFSGSTASALVDPGPAKLCRMPAAPGCVPFPFSGAHPTPSLQRRPSSSMATASAAYGVVTAVVAAVVSHSATTEAPKTVDRRWSAALCAFPGHRLRPHRGQAPTPTPSQPQGKCSHHGLKHFRNEQAVRAGCRADGALTRCTWARPGGQGGYRTRSPRAQRRR